MAGMREAVEQMVDLFKARAILTDANVRFTADHVHFYLPDGGGSVTATYPEALRALGSKKVRQPSEHPRSFGHSSARYIRVATQKELYRTLYREDLRDE